MSFEDRRKLSQCSHIFGKPREDGTKKCLICMYIKCNQCDVEFTEGEYLGRCKKCGRIHLRLSDQVEVERKFKEMDRNAMNKLKRG